MRRLFVVPIAAAFVLAGIIAHAPTAWACSCVSTPVAEHVDRADAVFTGLVTSVDRRAGRTLTSMAIDAIYKGRVEATMTITGGVRGPGGGDCEIEFVPGRRYAVFAGVRGSTVTTGLCSGTTDDVGVLARAGYVKPRRTFSVPGLAASGVGARQDKPVRGVPIAVAAVLLTGAGATLLVHRRRERSRPVRGEPRL